jgi:hypothetical protein
MGPRLQVLLDLAPQTLARYISSGYMGGGTLAMLLARVAIAILLLLLPTVLHAQAEKRIALLIGNKDYKAGVGALTNPLNDIRIVGEALQAVGYAASSRLILLKFRSWLHVYQAGGRCCCQLIH